MGQLTEQSVETLTTQKEYTAQELNEAEKVACEENPFRLVEGGFFTIRTKGGELKKLILNSTQKKILDRIYDIIVSGKPVRLWILKARQAGCSTLIEAILYAFTSQRSATNSLVVSKDIDGANYIFGMQKVYHEELDAHLKPQIKHSNEKKLEFASTYSQILISTADDLDLGRSFTFRYVHLSEISFYRDLEKLMLGLNQAIPDLPGTIVIGETTANGIGNQFYNEWMRCKEGLSDWQTLFIPWYEVEEYTKPLQDGKLYPIEGITFLTADGKDKFLQNEQDIKRIYNLSDEQLNWRRWCIVNNCNGSLLQWSQEYPITDMEAFVSTGDTFFDKDALAEQEAGKPTLCNIVREEHKYSLRECATGLFKIYEMPSKDKEYCIGADCAEGVGGDKSAAVVLDKKSNKTVAAYNCNVSPDRFETDLIKLGNFYNEALIAVENKGYGFSVNQNLYKSYGKVYRKTKVRKGFKEPTLDIGFNTNSVMRPMILAQMKAEIEESSTELVDKELINQCYTFINNPERGQPEAEKGKCDDIVLARAIAGYVRSEYPFKPRRKSVYKKEHYRGLSGY